ncbi:tyrosine-type recombinase/integrase [Nocardioides pantholopis]|uniref:tyrosine-type recombinase/integrase n=1 Tax=Nocardioides pantholopis TaxID=2483798 RepID=UPI000F07F117|nr:site-specific integrase [Nocardioides pantholopis]
MSEQPPGTRRRLPGPGDVPSAPAVSSPAGRRARPDRRVKVAITVTDEDGGTRRAYFRGRTRREARAKAEEARRRVAAGAPVRDSERTLAEWLGEWRRIFLRASDRAASTKALYAGLTIRHVEPVIGQVRLSQLRPTDVTRLLLAMEQAGKAASTRRNAYAALRAALDDAVANGLLATNPVLRVNRPRGIHQEAASLTSEEVARLLAGAADLRYGPVLRFILGTGLRRGEALAARWADVDLDRGELKVTGSLVRQAGRLQVIEPETARSRRTVSLSPAMLELLRTHRSRQNQERLRAANLWEQTGFVFTTEFGHSVDPRNLLRTVRLACAQADLAEISVHTLRHTYATAALLHGVPVHVVSRNLGHSSIVITVDTYGHLTDEASRAAAVAVSEALNL